MPSEADRAEFRAGIRITREITPGQAAQSDRKLDDFVRQYAETAFHPSGSLAMGMDDMAVVDAQGRVHGLEGLRVIDASIMPQIVTGNLNAPTLMMAEKIVDNVRGRTPLARVEVAYHVANGTPACMPR